MFVLFTVVPFVLALVALVDIVPRDDSRVQHLPKLVWVLLVVLLPVLGSVLWFTVGRTWEPRERPLGRPERSAVHASAGQALDRRVRSTEQQLADLEAEEEHYARLARLARLRDLEAEVERRRAGGATD